MSAGTGKRIQFAAGMKKNAPKVKAPPKKPVNFRLPSQMKKRMAESVVTDYGSSRKKSEWIRVAISDFLKSSSWCDVVLDGEMAASNDADDTCYLSDTTREKIKMATEELVAYAKDMHANGIRNDPLESLGVNSSAIIRSAIASRLFKEFRVNIPPPPKDLKVE